MDTYYEETCELCGETRTEISKATGHNLSSTTYVRYDDDNNKLYYKTCKDCKSCIYTDKDGNKRYSMETLKVKINKEKFVEIESGKNELVIGFTQALLKKISKDKSYTIFDLISNKELIKHFDELCILCMFSSDMITLPIEEMSVEEDGIHFILKNEKENVQTDEDKQNEGDKTPEPEDNGDETPEQCQHIAQHVGRRWYKAIQVKPELDVIAEIQHYQQAGASAVLLDAWHPELKGGTGHSFDWTQFPKLDIPLILAGGLKPDNIEDAIKTTNAYAVDVSGGVESAKGIKDQKLIEQFMQGVQRGSAK